MPTPKRVAGNDWPRPPRLDFDVTQEHIDTAKPKNSGHCMIADALRDKYPNATYVSVDLATIRFTDEAAGFRYIYLTPGYAQKALIDWDQGTVVEPFHLRQNCSQMTLTGSARKRRREDRDAEERTDTFLIQPRGGAGQGSTVPARAGGTPLPKGELAGTTRARGRDGKADNRGSRGSRREFGIRRFIR